MQTMEELWKTRRIRCHQYRNSYHFSYCYFKNNEQKDSKYLQNINCFPKMYRGFLIF